MTPKTPEAYARYLYGMVTDSTKVELMNETQIVDCRVRAFIDGVKWARRQFRKNNAQKRKPTRRSAPNGEGSRG
jgi:hypothetical protein